jgi:hypothetical protein
MGGNTEGNERAPPRFDYETYMQNLQYKLAEHQNAATTATWAAARSPIPMQGHLISPDMG